MHFWVIGKQQKASDKHLQLLDLFYIFCEAIHALIKLWNVFDIDLTTVNMLHYDKQ